MGYSIGKRASQGKIARLPYILREAINERLLTGQSGREILTWLNDQPEVKAKADANPDGWKISPQNLSNWRNGAFLLWKYRDVKGPPARP